jgi:anti-sigma regulatory factor (Ser/Thr protein kinase)
VTSEDFAYALVSLGSLESARRLLGAWLRQVGAAEASEASLVLAVHEALANALRHSGTTEPVTVHGSVVDHVVTVDVVDHGTWAPAPDGHTGLGLAIIDGAVESANVETGPGGTHVRLVQSLG